MFTGIINYLGLFKGYGMAKQELALEAPAPLVSEMELGESLAIDGVCLSLIKKEKNILFFNLSEETVKKTTLGALRRGDRLNLELPLKLSSPLSGHLVTGHVDAKGKVLRVIKKKGGKRLTISFPTGLSPFFISKGSVALNGVSLTIADLRPSSFDVEIIPITHTKSNIGDLKAGDGVNLECDMLGKYVYNWMTKERHTARKI